MSNVVKDNRTWFKRVGNPFERTMPQKVKKARIAAGDPQVTAEGSVPEILLHDVKRMLAAASLSEQKSEKTSEPNDPEPAYIPLEKFTEIEVKISEISSTGDGIGLSKNLDHAYVVPFTVPGDVVIAKIVKYFQEEKYTQTDFVKVIEPSARRDDAHIKCQYFARCGGCQLQMLPYDDQLAHKKTIIQRAYQNFSGLPPELVPTVGDTIGSPLEYGYRTKLTPHFDGPPGRHSWKRGKEGNGVGYLEVPPIGFNTKGMRRTIDIEDCPIGTDAVREGLKIERARIAKDIAKYRRGATVLLRESTKRTSTATLEVPELDESRESVDTEADDGSLNADNTSINLPRPVPDQAEDSQKGANILEEKTCITDSSAIATEYVDSFVFNNLAGSFFQNNNSILPRFTAYIREHALPPHSSADKPIRYLIDAYCGSGLFTITLSSLFSASIGIDISTASIKSARENAKINIVKNAEFLTADASALFAEVTFPPEETVMVIDPPKKGCDSKFLKQLLHFGPRRVVYVSCNVHTQARDVGVLVQGEQDYRYNMNSLKGFDFFPQTGQVESVAILDKVEK